MLKCFLVRVPITFASGSSSFTGAATTAAGAAGAPAPPRIPTGISRSISFPSPIWIFITPPAAAATAGAGAAGADTTAASSFSASSAGSSTATSLNPSTTSAVSAVSESHVFFSFAPRTCSIVSTPSRFKSPESTRSSKIAGSSRFAASIVMPSSALQHNTAGSFA